jgi:glycosyltransferase involved in cell wall biosynthesis
MTNKIKVSVLIPVFNGKSYLEQCIESVVGQGLREIEIICINDGSTDSSLQIMKDYKAKDSRIRIIDKANGGYGQSLNKGLRKAKGEYIAIVEADDFAAPDMLEKMYTKAIEHDAEVVKSDFFRSFIAEGRNEYFEIITDDLADKVIEPYYNYQILHPQPSIWSAIYKREFLEKNHIEFLETPGAAFQDTGFIYKVYTAASRVFLYRSAFIHNRQDSITESVKATGAVYEPVKELDNYFEYLDHYFPAKKERMLMIMQDIVYKTFRWNIRRISDNLQLGFLDYMHEYLKDNYEKGLIREEYFEPELISSVGIDLYKEVLLLVNDKDAYLAFTRGVKTVDKVETEHKEGFFQRIAKKISS